MLRRFFILVALMLFGPLFIELYLYHPAVALAHDPVAIFPRVAVAAALTLGFLVLAFDTGVTAALFALACGIAVVAGVIGTAIHLAIHAPTLAALATDPAVWLGGPPVLVPLSLAAAGSLGLMPLATPGTQPAPSPPAFSRMLDAGAALCGAGAAATAALVHGGLIALIAVVAGLGLGAFAYVAELVVYFYPLLRPAMAARRSAA
ncbi:MAG: hypothetical protein KGL11_06140 [Alphaproteobacteria bacterium]|nr:hypothetical protein [Alphaproteobacteria bacterium]